MRAKYIWYVLATSMALSISACASEGSEREGNAGRSPVTGALTVDDQVLALDFEAVRAKRQPADARIQRIGTRLFEGLLKASQTEDPNGPERTKDMPLAAAVERPVLRVSHLATSDDLLLVNGPVADDHSAQTDIGESEARRIFEQAISQLQNAKVDDVRGLDLSRTKFARMLQASVRPDKPETFRQDIKAYLFSAPRTVKGIVVMNSDITIAVHRTGRIASIRTRGALPGIAPSDAKLAAPNRRVLSADALGQRAQAEYPDAIVQSLGLMYPIATAADETGGKAVQPREVFALSEKLSDGTGRGRARRIAYSVTDDRAPGVFLDTQLKDDVSDVKR
jgi:hypothetical protein